MELILNNQMLLATISDYNRFKSVFESMREQLKNDFNWNLPFPMIIDVLQLRPYQPFLREMVKLYMAEIGCQEKQEKCLSDLQQDGIIFIRLDGDRREAFASMLSEHSFTCPRCGYHNFTTRRYTPVGGNLDDEREYIGYCTQPFLRS